MLKDMSTAKLTNGLLEWVQAITDGYAHLYIITKHEDEIYTIRLVAFSLYSRPT